MSRSSRFLKEGATDNIKSESLIYSFGGLNISIVSILEQIKNDEIVLPAIQRDFVWTEQQIEQLLDSIIRTYPVGITLLWETYDDIQHRNFVKDFRSGMRHTFHPNSHDKRLKLVLDGQQRLQSLYIALYGTYEGKYLYFDILSGRKTADFEEERYFFHFYTPEEVVQLNGEALSDSQNLENKENEKSYYCKVQDLLAMGAKQRQEFRRDMGTKLKLSDDDSLRLELNLSILRDALTSDVNILKTTVIDENKPRESHDRKEESDILEAFVRINRLGTRLERSDLIFSMLKLSWKESAESLPGFVDKINEGNSFEFDSDFVIRCLFAVSDLGTKFDVNLLRKQANVQKIKTSFQQCCEAIQSTADFVQNECHISSSSLLGGSLNLVPIVYYLFHASNHQVPNSQIARARKAIYLFGFTSPFSRYADSRLGKFIRRELAPLAEKGDEKFPLKDALYWVWYWERIENYGAQLLQGNYPLALHLVQRLSGAKVHYEKNAPQIDHIFPRSILREKKFDEAEINSFANFWVLAKNKNQNKYNRPPKEFFKDVDDSVLQKAYIDRNLLEYDLYRSFLKVRTSKILEHVKKELELTDVDYDVRAHWKID